MPISTRPIAAVIEVAQLFDAGGAQPVCFVDDYQFTPRAEVRSAIRVGWAAGPANQPPQEHQAIVEAGPHRSRRICDRRRVQQAATISDLNRHGLAKGQGVASFKQIPLGIVAGRHGLPDAGRAIADADVAFPSTGGAELLEAPVFLGHQEAGDSGGFTHARIAADAAPPWWR
jgi:hypothetical protein